MANNDTSGKPKTVKRRPKAEKIDRPKPKLTIPDREPDRRTKIERAGLIRFTHEKAADVADELAKAVLAVKVCKADIEDKKAEHKEEMSGLKGRLDEAENEAIRLAERHKRGGIEGTIQCERSVWYDEKVVTDVNVETGELEECRALEKSEHQVTLTAIDGGAGEPEPKYHPKPPSAPTKPGQGAVSD